jgi:hypothetical protein
VRFRAASPIITLLLKQVLEKNAMPTINSSGTIITTYDYFDFTKRFNNIVRLGRRWFGDDFNFNNEQTSRI